MLRLRSATRHDRPCAGGGGTSPSSAISPALTPTFSVGRSRNQVYQTAAHARPNTPNTKNEARHP